MKLESWRILLIIAVTTASSAKADDTSEEIKLLKDQIQQLDQRLRILDRKAELDTEVVEEKRKETPRLSAGAGGFVISSADTNFVLKIRGYVQADARFFAGEDIPANDTFLMRRVRPILEGTVFEHYDYRLMLDFASGLTASASNNPLVQEAYVNYRQFPQFQVQVGKFKEPVGLERLQSGANLLFVERGYPTQLVPNRDVGIQLQGEFFKGALNYAVGVFDGVADGGSAEIEASDDDKDIAARLFAHPFKNMDLEPLQKLGLGIAGTLGQQSGALRNFTTPGQQRFFAYRSGLGTNASSASVSADGQHWRLVPQGYYYWGPFGLFGEYAISSQEVARSAGAASTSTRLKNTGWQVSASYFLTGEDNSFKAIVPKIPLIQKMAVGALGK